MCVFFEVLACVRSRARLTHAPYPGKARRPPRPSSCAPRATVRFDRYIPTLVVSILAQNCVAKAESRAALVVRAARSRVRDERAAARDVAWQGPSFSVAALWFAQSFMLPTSEMLGDTFLPSSSECGNFNGGNKASYLDNQKDSMPSTIRELNGNRMQLNVQGQAEGAYHVTEHQKVFNRRDTTNYESYGNMTGNKHMPVSQESALNQHDNPYKESTVYNRFDYCM